MIYAEKPSTGKTGSLTSKSTGESRSDFLSSMVSSEAGTAPLFANPVKFGIKWRQRELAEDRRVIHLFHEEGEMPTVSDIETLPSKYKQRIRVRTSAAGKTSGVPSAEYSATLRRRRAANLKARFTELAQYEDLDTFPVLTAGIVERLKEAVELLANAKREGNTRALLNAMRASFFDGGWERYRRAAVRALAIECLQVLAEREWIESEDADHWLDRFVDEDLQITPGMILQ